MNKPNPGSKEAQEAGCLCPVIDNHYGRGVDDKQGEFWMVETCPLHGFTVSVKKVREKKRSNKV